MYIPDFMIADMCGENFPKTWAPSGGPDVGKEFPIENAGPLIEGFDPAFLGPASYDISVGLKFASPSALQGYVVRKSGNSYERMRPCNGSMSEIDGSREVKHPGEGIEVVLEPDQAVLCHSVEYVRVPPHLAAALSMRSSFARDWLDHSAADSIWPGFQGTITFELRNHGPRPYLLRSGTRPLQLAFVRMAAIPARPYNGLYQKQEAQLHSRMAKDGV
jgi:deoxycytidine triphosphate deaminase